MKFLQKLNPFYWILKKRQKKNDYQKALEKIGYMVVIRMDNDRKFRRILKREGLEKPIDQIMFNTVNKSK